MEDKLNPEEEMQMENELLRTKLQLEHGMKHMETGKLSPELENKWLNYIYNYESVCRNAPVYKIYDFIGRPNFKKAGKLKPDEIEAELDRLMELMYEKQIRLSIICEYPDEVIYSFITEELFNEEISDIDMPGMFTNFIYEEFHPNHEHDIKERCTELITQIFKSNWDESYHNWTCCDQIQVNNGLHDKSSFAALLNELQQNFPERELLKIDIHSVSFDLESSSGKASAEIEYILDNTKKIISESVQLELRSEFDWWSVSKITTTLPIY